MVDLESKEKARLKKSAEVCESLDNFRDRWISQKQRQDDERLEDEEKFALLQWFDAAARAESRLKKYSILNIVPVQGHMKSDDLDEDDFRRGQKFIENDLGQRLIYPGDQPGPDYLKNFIPGGQEAGTLYWKNEPSEGWEAWEEQCEETEAHEQYATKWHYTIFDYPEKPWFADDAGDVSFAESVIPGYGLVVARWRQYYAGRVPRIVTDHEKKEIKKWLWTMLMPYPELKMKLAYFGDQHKKFLRVRSVAELCELDFKETLMDLANPGRWYTEGAEAKAAKEKQDASERLKKRDAFLKEQKAVEKELNLKSKKAPTDRTDNEERDLANLRRKKAQLGKSINDTYVDDKRDVSAMQSSQNKDEQDLLGYALMRFEDTYKEGEEPWWKGCDEPQKGETKVMLDEEKFWQEISHKRLVRAPHLPKKG